ncbi:hypothetical protein ABT215_13575, partial [Streptomyces sp900105755]
GWACASPGAGRPWGAGWGAARVGVGTGGWVRVGLAAGVRVGLGVAGAGELGADGRGETDGDGLGAVAEGDSEGVTTGDGVGCAALPPWSDDSSAQAARPPPRATTAAPPAIHGARRDGRRCRFMILTVHPIADGLKPEPSRRPLPPSASAGHFRRPLPQPASACRFRRPSAGAVLLGRHGGEHRGRDNRTT